MVKNKRFLFIAIALVALYFLSRLIHLTLIPIFTDEAIYLWWAKIGLLDNSQRFISLTDGKQPLIIWMFTLMMRVVHDPLIAGRLVSVLCGFIGFTGMFMAGWEIFKSKTVGLWASFLYLVSPFFLLYDRLALYDSLVAALTVWSIYLIVLLVRLVRLDVALLLSWVLGAGMLTKTNALFNILLLPPSLVMASRVFFKKRTWVRWCLYALVASGIGYVMYNLLRLSPWFYIIARKNEEFVYPLGEWIHHPWQYFLPNLDGLSKWLVEYLTLPLAVAIIVGTLWGKTYIREKIFLLWAFIFPFLALAFFGKVLFPRFLLFMTVPLYLLVAYFIEKFVRERRCTFHTLVILIILFFKPLTIDWNLLFDPVQAEIPHSDRNQYFDDWPSGYGVREVIAYLRQDIQRQPVYVATEGTFGLFPAAFELYFVGDSRIQLHGYWPLNTDTIIELRKIARVKPTYVVFKETKIVPEHWQLKRIFDIPRGRGNTFLHFYQVLPEN